MNSEKGTVECFLRYEVLYPELLQGMFFLGEKVYFYDDDKIDAFIETCAKIISERYG